MKWHPGRSAGVGLFSSLCTAIIFDAALYPQLTREGGLDRHEAMLLPGFLLAFALMIGPVAGVVWHAWYAIMDRMVRSKPVVVPSTMIDQTPAKSSNTNFVE